MATYGLEKSGLTVTGLITSDLTDGNNDDSDNIALGAAPLPFYLTLNAELACGTGANGYAAVYAKWSDDASSHDSPNTNATFLGNIQCVASTTVRRALTLRTQQDNLIITVDNQSGGTITATGTSFSISAFKGNQP